MKKTRMLSLITATAMLAGTTAGCKGKKAEKKEIKVFDAFIAAELTNESEENIIPTSNEVLKVFNTFFF